MLLSSQFMPSNTFQEFEKLLTEKLTPMFTDLVGIGDDIPMRVVDTYILGENGGGVVDYLKDGDDTVEKEICMVTKFLGFNDAKSEMQVPRTYQARQIGLGVNFVLGTFPGKLVQGGGRVLLPRRRFPVEEDEVGPPPDEVLPGAVLLAAPRGRRCQRRDAGCRGHGVPAEGAQGALCFEACRVGCKLPRCERGKLFRCFGKPF